MTAQAHERAPWLAFLSQVTPQSDVYLRARPELRVDPWKPTASPLPHASSVNEDAHGTAFWRAAVPPQTIKAVERELLDYCVDLENQAYVIGRAPIAGWLGPGDLVAGHLAAHNHYARKVSITMTRPPTHGRVVVNEAAHRFSLRRDDDTLGTVELRSYLYTPERAYLGKDFVAFDVDVDGQVFRISFELRVLKEYIPEGGADQCPSDIEPFPNDAADTAIASAHRD